MKKRVHVFYSGRVQGVGFRMTAEEAARHFDVVGWARNVRGGKVELVAEAEEAVLNQLLETIRSGPMKNFIQDVEISWSNALDTFNDFEIRYY